MTANGKANDKTPLDVVDRDRLYREWVLPHLSLLDEHRSFVTEYFGLTDLRGFKSHPGSVRIPLEERAPVDELRRLPCCVIRGSQVSLAGPREGGLLIPFCDPRGHYTAFQILSNRQLEALRNEDKPGPIRWWQAAGTPKPFLPGGELPLQAVRTQNRELILARGLAAAHVIATKWQCSAVATTDDQFSLETLNQYLAEMQPKHVSLLLPRTPVRSACQRAWDLCTRLQESGWDIRILVPVLTDEELPERQGSCAQLTIESWLDGLSESIRNQLLGKNVKGRLNDHLERLNKERHVTATGKIRIAYERLHDVHEDMSINSLALEAGVAWHTVHDWLEEQGIGDTAKLRRSMEEGWEPPETEKPAERPQLGPASSDAGNAKDAQPSLFDFNKDEEAAADENDAPAEDTTDPVATGEDSPAAIEEDQPDADVDPEPSSNLVAPGQEQPQVLEDPSDDQPMLADQPTEDEAGTPVEASQEIEVEVLPVDEDAGEVVEATPLDEPSASKQTVAGTVAEDVEEDTPDAVENDASPQERKNLKTVKLLVLVIFIAVVLILAAIMRPTKLKFDPADLPNDEQLLKMRDPEGLEKIRILPSSDMPGPGEGALAPDAVRD